MTILKILNIDEAKDALAIDQDDLDTCLIEQPELLYHVADQYVLAIAERDEAKLLLDEAEAEADGQARNQSVAKNVKVTEPQLKMLISTLAGIKDANRNYLNKKQLAGRWEALKEAYEQRSYMLTKLVDRQITQLQSLGVERGMTRNRTGLTEGRLAETRAERWRPTK